MRKKMQNQQQKKRAAERIWGGGGAGGGVERCIEGKVSERAPLRNRCWGRSTHKKKEQNRNGEKLSTLWSLKRNVNKKNVWWERSDSFVPRTIILYYIHHHLRQPRSSGRIFLLLWRGLKKINNSQDFKYFDNTGIGGGLSNTK